MHHPPSLAVSIVVYMPVLDVLRQTLASLAGALEYAWRRGALGTVRLFVVDNSPVDSRRDRLQGLLAEGPWAGCADSVELLAGHGNIGYGAANNLAIGRTDGDFHLVLNPDVQLAEDCLFEALGFMTAHPDVGLLAPSVVDGAGKRDYLCKRYPSVLDLLLRGFAPAAVKRLFQQRLERYELRDLIGDTVVFDIPIVSGCFMLFRRPVLAGIGGFSPAFFLYFEDFDISLRAAKVARTAYVPAARIVHLGGGAARKGPRHIALFLRSALTFFNRHGWKWR